MKLIRKFTINNCYLFSNTSLWTKRVEFEDLAKLKKEIMKVNETLKHRLLSKVICVKHEYTKFFKFVLRTNIERRCFIIKYDYDYTPILEEVDVDTMDNYHLPKVGVCINNKIVWKEDYV